MLSAIGKCWGSVTSSDKKSIPDVEQQGNKEDAAILDANSNCIDWGTVFLTHLYNTHEREQSPVVAADVLDLFSPSKQREEPFPVPRLDDFFRTVDFEQTSTPADTEPLLPIPPPARMVLMSPPVRVGHCDDQTFQSQRKDARGRGGAPNNVNNGNKTVKSGNGKSLPALASSSATTRGSGGNGCSCSRPTIGRDWKFRGQNNKKEDEVTPLPSLPNSAILKTMMKWYIHSSISDLLWKIAASSEEKIRPLVEALLDLPLEEYEWCWPYLSTQIYIKIMNNPLVTLEHQVAFWQSLHMKSNRRCSCKIVERLTSHLRNQIGLLLKGKPSQLLSNFTLRGPDAQSEAKLNKFFSAIFKFSKFVDIMLGKGHLNMGRLLGNLLEASENLKDIKSLTLFLATVDQVSSTMKEEFFEFDDVSWYVPPFDDHQLGLFQIYGKLKSIANKPSSAIPTSIVHFINGMVICRTEAIHLQWRKLGVSGFTSFIASDRPKIDAAEEKERGQKDPIRPIEKLLQNDIINEFYVSVIYKYMEMRDIEAKFAREGKTFL